MPNVGAACANLASLLLLAALTAAVGGCVAPVRVAFDERQDFSHYRTWGWRPNVTATLSATSGRKSPLNTLLADKIARELTRRGYEPRDDVPDLVVGYGLDLERRTVLVQVPRAPYLLSSMHSSPSYWIEGTDLEKQRVADVTIAIEIADRQGRSVWTAESTQRLQYGRKIDLDAAIGALLESFPQRRALPESP